MVCLWWQIPSKWPSEWESWVSRGYAGIGVVMLLSGAVRASRNRLQHCLALTTENNQLSSAIVTCYKEKTAHNLFSEMRSK